MNSWIKVSLILCCFALCGLSARAGDVPRPEPGASIDLIMRQENRKALPTGGEMAVVVETPIQVECLAFDDGATLIRWTRGELNFVDIFGTGVPEDEIGKQRLIKMIELKAGSMPRIADGLRFDLKIDGQGVYAGLDNFDEIHEWLLQTFNKIADLQRRQNPDFDEQIWQNTKDLFLTRQNLETFLPKNALMYLSYWDYDLDVGESSVFTLSQEDFMNTGPLDFTMTAVLRLATPPEKGDLVLTIGEVDFDRDQMMEIMTDIIATVAGEPRHLDQQVFEDGVRNMVFDKSSTHFIDRKTGWSVYAKMHEIIRIPGLMDHKHETKVFRAAREGDRRVNGWPTTE